MKKKLSKKLISENSIINKFFKKLTNNNIGTFNLENDAGYLNFSNKNKTVVTTDTIIERIDFFPDDPPESIAQKLICVNLSDLSSMGSFPKAYTLNLSINSKIDVIWLKKFTKRLNNLQKKFNFYLIGGDISKSKQLTLTSTFFGHTKLKNILSQNKCYPNEDIWVTGNLGNSFMGYNVLKNPNLKIKKNKLNFYKKSYLFPKPCMFGSVASKYISCATDISDGFYGDLNKILNNKYGAKIKKNNLPVTTSLKNIINDNKSLIFFEDIFNWGDDYELIFTANKKLRNKILNLANSNNIKLSNVGTVIKKIGIYDDSYNLIKKTGSYDHFL